MAFIIHMLSFRSSYLFVKVNLIELTNYYILIPPNQIFMKSNTPYQTSHSLNQFICRPFTNHIKFPAFNFTLFQYLTSPSYDLFTS